MAPLEDDELFKDRPRAPRRRDMHDRVPYHEMSDEERRAAWASLRAAQRRRARRGRLGPFLWFGVSAACFLAGAGLGAAGSGFAAIFNWLGVVFVAFALVSLGRGLFGRSAGAKDDFAPPGF